SQQEPSQKASYDIIVPKRVVQVLPQSGTAQDLSEIKKLQEQKQQEQTSGTKNTNAPVNRVTSEDLKKQELHKKQEEYGQLKKNPE
ncbi:MAG TPA: hypothetical protein VNJ07_06985, partial [Chitinophagales bacterium]|nr:hypothetical protein [Chitinophagales bacterium]